MIGCRIMTLELLELTDLDYIDFLVYLQGQIQDFWKGCSYV